MGRGGGENAERGDAEERVKEAIALCFEVKE